MLLHLHHTLIDNADQQMREKCSMHVNILILFLEQFGTLWKLPKLLVGKWSSTPFLHLVVQRGQCVTILSSCRALQAIRAPGKPVRKPGSRTRSGRPTIGAGTLVYVSVSLLAKAGQDFNATAD